MKNISKRISVMLLVVCMLVGLVLPAAAADSPSATNIVTTPTDYKSAADVVYVTTSVGTKQYIANWGARGEVATFVSSKAADYYGSDYTYEKLSALSGGSGSTASGSDLFTALNTLATTQQTWVTSYDALRDLYAYTDCVSSDTTQISLIYTGNLVSSTWDSGTTYNREHCWPASKCISEGSNDGADLVQIRPETASANSSRGNTAYGESSGYYDPGVSVHGDIARIILYTYVRWQNEANLWGTSGVFESLDVLLSWHAADPVDTWEMGRNDAIQSITGARNMFVDYPELAYSLFGQEVPADLVTPSSFSADSGDSGSTDDTGSEDTGSEDTGSDNTGSDTTTESTPAGYYLISNVSELTDGNYIVVGNGTTNALSTTISGKIAPTTVTIADGYIAETDGLPVWTIQAVTGGYTLSANGAYLSYKSSTNFASSATAYTWVGAVSDGVVTFSASGATTRGLIYRLGTTNKFGAYANSNLTSSATEHVALQLYKYKEASTGAECTHSWSEEIVAATCTEQGYTKHTCTLCSEEYVDNYTPVIAHDYVDGVCSVCKLVAVVWNKVELTDITASDVIAITMTTTEGVTYALFNGNGTSDAPRAVVVLVDGDVMNTEESATISWNIISDTNGLTIYVNDGTTWLYSTNTGNGTRVGTNTNQYWTLDATTGYLMHVATSRYLGVYTATPDWRSYTLTEEGAIYETIADQTLSFWKLYTGEAECEHDYQGVVTAPTCTEAGYTTYTCSVCGDSYTADAVAKTGHQNEEVSRTEPTCTEAGESNVKCTVCGSDYTYTLPATGHTYENGVCTACGEEEPTTVTELTINFATTTQRVSQDSSAQVWANGDFVMTNNKASSTNNVASYYNPARFYASSQLIFACPNMERLVIVCNSASYATALGNSITAGDNETVTVDGSTVTIEFATPVDSYEIAALGAQVRVNSTTAYIASAETPHEHAYEAVVTAPTCTAGGYTTYSCACGDSYTADEAAALGHSWTDATCTAAKTCSVCGTTEGEALGHPAVTYSYANSTHTFTCTTCNEVAFTKADTESKQFKIASAQPELASNIVMYLGGQLPTGFSDPRIVVEFNGNTSYLSEYTINSKGRYEFAFDRINPKTMGDTFTATLYATVEGYEVSAKLEYSMLKYLNSQLKKTSLSAANRTVMSDLIAYGDANQLYASYKTDALISTQLEETATLTPSTFTALADSYNAQKVSGVEAAEINFKGVSLLLDSKVVISVKVYCPNAEGYTVNVNLAGVDYTYPVSELEPIEGQDNYYYLNFEEVRASQFDEVVTVSFLNPDGAQVSRTLEYSVYTYIQKNQNSTDTKLVNLLQAIYNYGESAKKI